MVAEKTRECDVCRRLVCPACASDWSTCDQPYGRVVRLGVGARLRDVDPSGRIGIVSRWRGTTTLVDLRRLRWIEGPELPRYTGFAHAVGPTLTRDRLLTPEYDWLSTMNRNEPQFVGLRVMELAGGASVILDGERPARAAGRSPDGDRYWYVSEAEQVNVYSVGVPRAHGGTGGMPKPMGRFSALPGKVIQAACVDGEHDLLAASTWGVVAVGRIEYERFVPMARVTVEGDVRWLAIGGGRLAAAIATRGVQLRVWSLAEDGTIGEAIFDHVHARTLSTAALSRDGRYLAVGLSDDSVVVHDLERRVTTRFTEHTDDVILVRFVGDEQLLVTADADNRVVLRPRTPNGYTEALLPLAIGEETIDVARALRAGLVDEPEPAPPPPAATPPAPAEAAPASERPITLEDVSRLVEHAPENGSVAALRAELAVRACVVDRSRVDTAEAIYAEYQPRRAAVLALPRPVWDDLDAFLAVIEGFRRDGAQTVALHRVVGPRRVYHVVARGNQIAVASRSRAGEA
jgi:hypothetical protein